MDYYVYTPAPVGAVQWHEGDGTVLGLSGNVVIVADGDYLTRDERGDVKVIPAQWFEAHYKAVPVSDAEATTTPIDPIPSGPTARPDDHPAAHTAPVEQAPETTTTEAPLPPWMQPPATGGATVAATPPAEGGTAVDPPRSRDIQKEF